MEDPKKDKLNLKPQNLEIMFLLTYFLTWLTGIIIYFTQAKNNKRLKFHALQAIFFGIVIIVIGLILDLFSFLFLFAHISTIFIFLAWLYGMYIGYMGSKGDDIEIPIIGEYAKKYSEQ